MIDLSLLRREYSLKTLNESKVNKNPIIQFHQWLDEAVNAEVVEPNAMALATSTFDGYPSLRMLLLKDIKDGGFIFFTNYESRKAHELNQNPNAAIVFMWHELERQVRIEGKVSKISEEDSDKYFESRPERSKLGAWASPQSKIISSRKYLEELMCDFEEEFEGKVVKRPENWGGYILVPSLIEFWQGRENRLHDRIQYTLENGVWSIVRLAP